MEGMEETNARVAKVLAPYYLELIRKDIQHCIDTGFAQAG